MQKLRTKHNFSSSTNDLTKDSALSTREISYMFNVNESKGIKIAQKLSPSTRRELSEIKKKLSNCYSVKPDTQELIEPTSNDLKIHALTCGIPFIGFGIMDNAILIWAGDQIDTHLGVIFGISTLCAAAIGNIVSDIAGVGLGAYIEDFCATKLSLPKVNLSSAQRNLRSVRFAGQIGNMIGLTIGCIIGMFPLLLIDTDKVQQMKKKAHMDQIFNDVVTEAKGLIRAESTCLYLVVDDKTKDRHTPLIPLEVNDHEYYLYAKYETENISSANRGGVGNKKEPVSRGIVGRAASLGEVVIVSDVINDPDYDPSLASFHKTKDDIVKNMLCVPVFDVEGKIIAVIQAINKVEQNATEEVKSHTKGFTSADAKVLQSLASHISVSLQNIHLEEDASLKQIIKILKEHEA